MKEIQINGALQMAIGSEKLIEQVIKNLFKPRMPDLANGVYEQREFAEKVSTLPRFELTARPLEIPPELLTQPHGSDVIFRSCHINGDFDTVEESEFVLKLFREKINRQMAGYFELWDAAEILSSAMRNIRGERMPRLHMRTKMIDAFNQGTLTFYDEYGYAAESWWLINFRHPKPGYTAEKSIPGANGETTTPKAINAWLESTGSPHRFPEPTTPPAPPVVEVAASEPDWGLMATPAELCAAFGTFTGMNKQWFDNLKDVPQLKAARFRPGQGGRNKREPLFYVYPVLQWLIYAKRRKGKPMSLETGWRMLKSHFPYVHSQYSIGDPNAD